MTLIIIEYLIKLWWLGQKQQQRKNWVKTFFEGLSIEFTTKDLEFTTEGIPK